MTTQACKVNLGCCIYPLKGFINVDIYRWDGVDKAFDLNKTPWPFDDLSVSHIRAVDILEHLGKITKSDAVGECARILKPFGTMEVRVPCCSHPWALASLQHAHSFYFNSFEHNYAQPWFDVERIYAGFGHFRIRYNAITRPFLKLAARMGLVQTITFHLRKA